MFNPYARRTRHDAPEFLIVNFDRNSHYNAVQQLVRPWEVEHLFTRDNTSPRVLTYRPPFANQVAQWLEGELDAGRLSYVSDPNSFDVWSSPAMTLRRRGGDCEDLTLLTVSILLAGGVSAKVAVGRLPGGGHAWVEGADTHGGFLIEATSGAMYRNVRPSDYTLFWHLDPNPSLRRVA